MSQIASHNLPTELSTFVGRDRDLAQLTQALVGARLVTLTGVGGVGKTRPGLRVAAGLVGEFADGVWLVELASLSDPLLVPRALAEALLRVCPGLTILATGREALGVPGERVWPVPPLSLPDPSTTASLRSVADSEAVRLFVARSTDALPDFTLAEQSVPAVIEICRFGSPSPTVGRERGKG